MAELFGGLTNRRPEALLFDLDGTLVDSVPDLAVAMDATLHSLGFDAAGEERVRQWVGNGALKLVERALVFSAGCTEQQVDRERLAAAHACFLEHYHVSNGHHSRLYPGVAEALQAWHREHIPMAIVTNKPIQFVPHLLDSLGVGQFFQVCLGGECVPRKKPDPEMLYEACRRLQVALCNCVMIGDSRNDVEAARAAGVPVVAVNYGYNQGREIEREQPDRIVADLRELLR